MYPVAQELLYPTWYPAQGTVIVSTNASVSDTLAC